MAVKLERLLNNMVVRTASQFSLYILDHFWKKEDKLVVFTGLDGKWYTDNSRYLFEHCLRNNPNDLKFVWVTRNQDLIDRMERDPDMAGRFLHQYSPRGIMTLLRAKVVVHAFLTYDLPIIFSRRTTTLQLWHGIPIKAIGIRENKRSPINNRFKRLQMDVQHTYWMASSETDKRTTMLCTGLPEDRVLVTGYPRNDRLVRNGGETSGPPDKLANKVILYAPTWRPEKAASMFPFPDMDMEELERLLEEFDARLLLRGHYRDDLALREGNAGKLGKKGRIMMANRDLVEDVQELLPQVDVLVSDYSGIWVDYLLLDRPMIFVPYDLEEYAKSPGLMYDFNEVTPGPKVSDFQGFMAALRECLRSPARYQEERRQTRKMFHAYEDGRASERIYEIISKHA